MGPTNKELIVIMKMRDEMTKVLNSAQGNLIKFANNFKDFGKTMSDAGRQVSEFGRNLSLLGGVITGPLILAFKNSANYSADVRIELDRLSAITNHFQLQIATVMIPVVHNLINVLANLSNWFGGLSEITKNMIIQGGFMTGVVLALAGAFAFLGGKLIQIVGVLIQSTAAFLKFASVNAPLVLIIGTILAITYLLLKKRDVIKDLLNTFQTYFLSLKQGFFDVKSHLEEFIASALENVSILAQKMAELGGPQREFMQGLALSSLEASNNLRELANEDIINAKIAALELQDIFTGSDGTWAEGFEGVVEGILERFERLKDGIRSIGELTKETASIAKVNFSQILMGLQQGLGALSASLSQAAQANKAFAEAARIVSLGLAIVTTAAGVARAFQDYPWPFSAVVAGLVGAAGAIQVATIASQKFHDGGMIRAHDGLAVDEVPIIAQRGEGVLSRRGMAALGGEANLNFLNAGGRSSGIGNAGDINIYIGPVTMAPGSNINELAEKLSDLIRRQRRYYGLS